MYYDIVPSLKKVYLHKRNIILHLTMHGWLNTVYVMRDIMFDSECLLKRPIVVNIKIN